MKKRIKIGVVLCALLAFGAVVASSAFGAKGEWDFAWEDKGESTKTVTFEGTQVATNEFTVPGGVVKCTTATFKGTSTGTTVETVATKEKDWASHEVNVKPTYSGCTAFGQAAEVTTTGCSYDLTPTSTTAGVIKAITCETGKVITVTSKSGACTVTVAAQTPGTPTVDFTESGTGASRDILLTATVGGIKSVSSGGICGAKGESSTGTYKGSVTVKGFVAGTQIGIGLVETVE